jgi:predicted transposase/invertase (TIGR01784 family)
MNGRRLLDPKNDFCFKRTFGTDKNKEILMRFLNDMIPFPDGAHVTNVTFLPTSLDPEAALQKQSGVDVLCMDERQNQYIVEMQVASTPGFEKRAQYYAAKAYTSQIKEGGAYQNLKEIIFLAITDFIMFPEIKTYKSDHLILERSTHQNLLKDFYFCFLELPKFNKEFHELSGPIEKWAYFFKHASHVGPQEVEEIEKEDPVLHKAYLALNQFNWSELELITYERELKRRMDAEAIESHKINTAFAKGEAQGEAKATEKMKLMIKNLLKRGFNPKDIEQASNLTADEINSLIDL